VLTVRHIDESGLESIRETKHVTVGHSANQRKCVGFCDWDDEFTSGTIFVMNEMGRTVAKYDLGPPLAGAKAVEDLSERFPTGVIREEVTRG
jgi:hypothetical protein